MYGPNSSVGSGSLLLLIERQAEYAVQAILKMQRERLKSMEVKAEAVNDFDQYMEVWINTSTIQQKSSLSGSELFPQGVKYLSLRLPME